MNGQDHPGLTVLGSTITHAIEHVEVFPARANVTIVRFSNDELTSICPPAGQVQSRQSGVDGEFAGIALGRAAGHCRQLMNAVVVAEHVVAAQRNLSEIRDAGFVSNCRVGLR